MTLYLAPELDAADQRVLRGIAVSRKELGYRLAQPCRWQGQFRRTLTARAIRGSNSIEGYQVSLDDAEDAVEHEPPLEGSIVLPEIVGYRDALTFVQQLAGAPHFRYERMLLSALHFLMLDHRLDISPGRYRTGTTFVRNNQTHEVVYEGPEPERVPGLVDELLDWLAHGDADAPVYVRAAMAHLNLVNIHPWRDGNGRMSRCLHTLVLARDGVLAPEFASIEEWLGSGRNTYDYHEVLRAVGGQRWSPDTPGRDTHPWVRFCLRAHHMQAQLVRRRFDEYARLWIELENLAKGRGLPERAVHALFTAARGQRVRRATYQHDAGLSDGQAVRDLRTLTRAGLLNPVGETRARSHTAAAVLHDLGRRIDHDLPPIVDPYKAE